MGLQKETGILERLEEGDIEMNASIPGRVLFWAWE
jgi:hypothetical protein